MMKWVLALALIPMSIGLISPMLAEEITSQSSSFMSSSSLPEGVTRYEAEDAEVIDCQKKGKVEGSPADYGAYSGLGFVGSIDSNTSQIIFTVTAPQDGNYALWISYAIGTDFGTATLNSYVDGSFFTAYSFVEKKGWGSFDQTAPLATNINLHSGSNRLVLSKGYNYVEIDYIDVGKRLGDAINPGEISSGISKVPEGYTRYEAEKAKISSGIVYDTGTFSGTGYVGNLDYAGSSKIDFTVTAAEEGEFNLHMAYAIGVGFKTASFKIFNDAGLYTTLFCDVMNGWGAFDTNAIATGTISLHEGTNHVIVYKSVEFGQIDFIDISNAKIGPYKESAINVVYPDTKEGYTRYEAEEQTVVLGAPKGVGYFVDIGHYSGYGYVGRLDNDNCYVEVPVTVPEDGEYALRVCYAAYEAGASFKLYSGSYGRGGVPYFYGETNVAVAHGWGEFASDTIIETSVSIKAGKSYIILRAGIIALEIDYIDLGAKIGDYSTGTYEASLDRYGTLSNPE